LYIFGAKKIAMHFIHRLLPIGAALLLLSGATMYAQESTSKFSDKLWYGGGVNLGISGSNGFNQFGLGVSPMVGYKFGEIFSAGPRVALNYTHIRVRLFNNEIATANPLSWAAGVFGRAKVFRTIFAHVEYELEEQALAFISGNDLVIQRQQRNNTYIGAGYNSGGIWASEIMLLYNVTPVITDLRSPFVVRFGFTYKF